MGLTERLQILISPEMRKQLDERAETEGKPIGRLIREFVEVGLLRAPRQERLRIADEMRKLELPVGPVGKMKEESLDGVLGERG